MKVVTEGILEGGSRATASAPWGGARRGTEAESGQPGGGEVRLRVRPLMSCGITPRFRKQERAG